MSIGNGLSFSTAAALAGINSQNLLYGNGSATDPTTNLVINSLNNSSINGSNSQNGFGTNSPTLNPLLNLTSNNGLNSILTGGFGTSSTFSPSSNTVIPTNTFTNTNNVVQPPVSKSVITNPVSTTNAGSNALANQVLQLLQTAVTNNGFQLPSSNGSQTTGGSTTVPVQQKTVTNTNADLPPVNKKSVIVTPDPEPTLTADPPAPTPAPVPAPVPAPAPPPAADAAVPPAKTTEASILTDGYTDINSGDAASKGAHGSLSNTAHNGMADVLNVDTSGSSTMAGNTVFNTDETDTVNLKGAWTKTDDGYTDAKTGVIGEIYTNDKGQKVLVGDHAHVNISA